MDEMTREELKRTIRTLSALTLDYSYETAIKALEMALEANRSHFSDAAVLAARMIGYGLDTAPEKDPDLGGYDLLLQTGGSHGYT